MPVVSRVTVFGSRSWVLVSASVIPVALILTFSASPGAAQEIDLTVGPHGTYSTIQGAMDNLVSGWVNNVKIEAAAYNETFEIRSGVSNISSGELHVSGGWDSTFTSQAPFSRSTISALGIGGTVAWVEPAVSALTTITFSQLEFNYGMSFTGGGGLKFVTTGLVHLTIDDCRFRGNYSGSTGDAAGGGLFASITGGNSLTVRNSIFWLNLTEGQSPTSVASGAGAYVSVDGPSGIRFEGVLFQDNEVSTYGSAVYGGGLYLEVTSGAVWVSDCVFLQNFATGGVSTFSPGLGLFAAMTSNGWIELRRNAFRRNNGPVAGLPEGTQMELRSFGNSSVYAGDTLVIHGSDGVGAVAGSSSDLQLTNLTVVNTSGTGLSFLLTDATPSASLQNTILYGNGTDIALMPGGGTIVADHNLVGVNPVFLNPAWDDFRLAPGSPAENAGTNTPLADLGAADCDGAVRVIGGTVDIGAYEGTDVLFSDGFERRTGRWSGVAGG